MQYTTLGKTGLNVSRLGFGGMRFPMKGDRIDRDLSIPMLHRAFKRGVNLIDSAVMYCNHDSQRVFGEAIESWPGRIYISTKNHHYNTQDEAGWWKNLEDSLKRLRVDDIDLYHHHNVNWKRYVDDIKPPGGVLRWMLQARDRGLVRHVCFSWHDTAENLKKMAKTGHFEAVVLQYNLLDRSNEPAFAALHDAGIGIIVMGPVGAGRLGVPTPALAKLLPEAKSVPEIALRFVLSNPYVSVALSGMSTVEQVEENVRVASRSEPLTRSERRRVTQILARYQKLADLYCTGCRYCMPCPSGVNIPGVFMARTQKDVYGLAAHARAHYNAAGRSAVQCVACGQCLPKCPQGIDVVAQLRDSIKALDDRYGTIEAIVRPVRLERVIRRGRAVGAELRVRAELNNISDMDMSPEVSWSSIDHAAGTSVRPTVRRLGPFEKVRVSRTVRVADIRQPVDPGLMLRADAKTAILPPNFRVALAVPETQGPTRAVAGPSVRMDNKDQLVLGSSRALRNHAVKASFSYEGNVLIIRASVADDLLAPADANRRPAHTDRLIVFLDARCGRLFGTVGRAEGTTQLHLLAPSKPAAAKPKVMLFGPYGLDTSRIRLTTRRTKAGYNVTARVSLDLIGVKRLTAGARLGLDLALVSHNRAGKPVVRLSWTGDPDPLRSADLRGYLFVTDSG